MGRTTQLKNFKVKPVVLNAARALTHSDSGKTYFLNLAAGFTVNLPTPRAGTNFEFIVKTAPTTNNYSVKSHDGTSTIILGNVITNNQNAGADADFETSGTASINFIANLSKIGSSIEMVSDGTKWYANGFSRINNAITFD